MRVIGTAGHVDHGKSTLVEALSGIHPDRLKEEQAREMTIDLGFAWMDIPGNEKVGIIDVPGHHDFIENMLAGVGGIDAALLIIAADEGIMPQTREHLSIIDVLGIQGGVIILTKIDLIDDTEWLDLVEEDICKIVSGTVLETAPIVRVSSRSGEGIPELVQAIAECLRNIPNRSDFGRPRLPIDRVFTLSGFGTIVTGTLLDGSLRSGDEIEILPSGICSRIRGIQTYGKKSEDAFVGSRAAVNISGINVDQINRGDVLTHPGKYKTTKRVDAHFRLLDDTGFSIRHNSEVKMFIGSTEVLARLRLIGKEDFRQGEKGWLQIETENPVVALRGDRYILRRPSPAVTLGGGIIVEPFPRGRHKRFSIQITEHLEKILRGTTIDVVTQMCLTLGVITFHDLVDRVKIGESDVLDCIRYQEKQGKLVLLEMGYPSHQNDLLIFSLAHWESFKEKAVQEVENFHKKYPLRRGLPREELKSRLKLENKLFNAILRVWVQEGVLFEKHFHICHPGYKIRFNIDQKLKLKNLFQKFIQSPFSPPGVGECKTLVGDDVFSAIVDLGILVQVSPDVVFRKGEYVSLEGAVKDHFSNETTLTVAQFRDQIGSSRRYILAFLEHLDAIGVTVRDGDVRRLSKK